MKIITQVLFAAALTAAAVVSAPMAHAHETEVKIGNLVITKAWSRQSPMGMDLAAGFLVIQNTGTEDDRLVKATAEIAPKVQLHDMKMDGDMMKMFELPDGIAVPAGQTVELKPKSLHVMFMDLPAPVKEGDHFAGTLVFEKAGTADVMFDVLGPNAGME